MKLRFFAALWCAKTVRRLMRLLGRNATDLPGQLALKICPDFLRLVGRPEKIVAVTGTNGKTTTNNLLADVLTKTGHRVLSNRLGSNIASGIASCLLSGVSMGNKPQYPLAVLEVDERSALRIYPYVHPDILLCTNLARDSLFRNAHPYYIFDIIESALPDDTTLILNADDIISNRLKEGNPRVYFGIERQEGDAEEPFNLTNDARICPRCRETLHYEFVRYNQIGRVRCPRCGLASPEPDVRVEEIDREGRRLVISRGGERAEYPLINSSIFNIYNELSAVTVLLTMGLESGEIARALADTKIDATRYDRETVGKVRTVYTMTKSWIAPACSAVFDYVTRLPGEKELVLLLEDPVDNVESSENLTYLYDTDFEFLCRPGIRRIVVPGLRRRDFCLRLLLAGVPREKIFPVEGLEDVPGSLDLTGEAEVHVLYDMHQNQRCRKLRQLIHHAAEEAART